MPIFSIFILVFIFLFSFFGSVFYTPDPTILHAKEILLPPSFSHPFGTDRLGRDVLARVIEGGKVAKRKR
jgi:peptide/nickel transport system permease protein